MHKKILIDACNSISYAKACAIAKSYLDTNETEKRSDHWLGILMDRFVRHTGKNPEKIQVKGYWPKYWISVRETKTCIVIKINNAS